jgi:hypothetical protein
MLIIVSTCFLLLNAPAHLTKIIAEIYTFRQILPMSHSHSAIVHVEHAVDQLDDRTTSSSLNNDHLSIQSSIMPNTSEFMNYSETLKYFHLIMTITQHISYASYSINFFLYSFCGMKFRRELARCLSKPVQQLVTPRSTTVQMTM